LNLRGKNRGVGMRRGVGKRSNHITKKGEREKNFCKTTKRRKGKSSKSDCCQTRQQKTRNRQQRMLCPGTRQFPETPKNTKRENTYKPRTREKAPRRRMFKRTENTAYKTLPKRKGLPTHRSPNTQNSARKRLCIREPKPPSPDPMNRKERKNLSIL